MSATITAQPTPTVAAWESVQLHLHIESQHAETPERRKAAEKLLKVLQAKTPEILLAASR